MATPRTSPLIRHIHQTAAALLAVAVPDDQLLERFAVRHEEAAFAALVRRHGPLVLEVCRRVLQDAHAAEDAFQATFVVLARKAGALKRPEALGPWLYGVATRTALKVRAQDARRRRCERQVAVAEAVERADDCVWHDLRPVLDEAVARLPEKHRVPFVLHYLQGITVAEVARRVGCPQGTIATRLARAKDQLRGRLARKGLALSVGALTPALAQCAAWAAVPTPLAVGTVEAAMLVAAGNAAGALAATAAILTQGGVQAMSLSKVTSALAVGLTMMALGVGVGVPAHGISSQEGNGAGLAIPPAGEKRHPGHMPAACAPAFTRYYAGGCRSLRGFEFHGLCPKATGAQGRCEEPDIRETPSNDVRVIVREQPTGSLMFGLGVNSNGGLVGSIVLNEKNVDILRPPSRLEDVFESRAFRGAGHEFRIETVPGTQLQRYSVSCRDILRTPLNGLEHQVPIKANDPLYLVAFLDLGTVKRNVNVQDYRVSVGCGQRIKVPMLGPVPIALDFGFPIVKESEERKHRFRFWLGCCS